MARTKTPIAPTTEPKDPEMVPENSIDHGLGLSFTINANDLFGALSPVSRITKPSALMAVLGCVLLKTNSDGFVELSSCNGEAWYTRSVPAFVLGAGSILVPAKLFSEIVKSLGTSPLDVSLDKNLLVIRSGKSKFTINVMNAEDFPEQPKPPQEWQTLKVPTADLQKWVDKVIGSCSTEAYRAIITGVLFDGKSGKLVLTSTDTHRLAVCYTGMDCEKFSVVIPEFAASAILGLEGEEIEMHFGDGRIYASAPNASIVCQGLAGTFPNYERVIPSDSSKELTIAGSRVTEGLNRINPFAADNAYRVRVNVEGTKVSLYAISETHGEGSDAFDAADLKGFSDDFAVCLNSKYLRDAVKSIGAEDIVLYFSTNSKPVIVKSASNPESGLVVIMPMAIDR